MTQKSLRQLATELGVSHSYLSQIKNGKRPASDRIAIALEELRTSGKQSNGKQVAKVERGLGRDRTCDQSVMSRPLYH